MSKPSTSQTTNHNISASFSCLQPGGRTGVEGPALSTAQRSVLGLGYVVLPYVWRRLGQMATSMEWSER